MKIVEALKIIDAKWIEKKKGFRVCMQRREGSDWITDYTPDEDATPLDSDVAAWRTAWKLAQSTPLSDGGPQEGDMVNLYVVDQDNNPIAYYATGEKDVFNVCKV